MNLITNQTKYGQIKAVNFTKKSMKSWLGDNNIEMYSIYIEAKSIVTERPIRTLNLKFKNT